MAPFSHSSSSSSRQCWGAADEAAAKTQYPEARTTSHPRPSCLGPPRGELHGKRTEKRGRNTGAPALAPALALAQVFAAVQLGKLFFPLLREKEQSRVRWRYSTTTTALHCRPTTQSSGRREKQQSLTLCYSFSLVISRTFSAGSHQISLC